MTASMRLSALSWPVSFTCLAMLALALLRPCQILPSPPGARLVVDATGARIPLPNHVRVVPYLREYLPQTHAPAFLYRAGTPAEQAGFARSLFGRIYPELTRSAGLWKSDSLFGRATLEAELAWPADVVTLGPDNPVRRRLGALTVTNRTRTMGRDESMFSQIRISAAVIEQPAAEGEARISRYQRENAALDAEMRPDAVTTFPRMMGLGASSRDWSRMFFVRGGLELDGLPHRIGGSDAVGDILAAGRQQDAERLLTIDPDIILLLGTDTRDFMRDRRWQGLKAVRSRRVYCNNPAFNGFVYDLDDLPFSTRWLAEIVHPERLQPKLRGLVRAHYMEAYNYWLSDAEIDVLLNVQENSNSAGYARFMRNTDQGTGP